MAENEVLQRREAFEVCAQCSEHIEIDAMLTVYRLLRVRACVRVWCVFG